MLVKHKDCFYPVFQILAVTSQKNALEQQKHLYIYSDVLVDFDPQQGKMLAELISTTSNNIVQL